MRLQGKGSRVDSCVGLANTEILSDFFKISSDSKFGIVKSGSTLYRCRNVPVTTPAGIKGMTLHTKYTRMYLMKKINNYNM